MSGTPLVESFPKVLPEYYQVGQGPIGAFENFIGEVGMTDLVTPAVRSRMMSSIRGSNTTPELRVRKYLHAVGIRFRVNDQSLPGRPDLALPSRRIAIFVHGCFWHQHSGCRFASMPATRPEFWMEKFAANRSRDARNADQLVALGWQVLTIWECQTRDELELDKLAWQILAVEPTTGRKKKK